MCDGSAAGTTLLRGGGGVPDAEAARSFSLAEVSWNQFGGGQDKHCHLIALHCSVLLLQALLM